MKKKIETGALIGHASIVYDNDYQTTKYNELMALKDDNPVNQRMAMVGAEYKHVNSWQRSEYENVIYWSQSKMIPMYTDKFFIRYRTENGLSYNKKTKTISVWYGKNFRDLGSYIKNDVFRQFKEQVEFLTSVDEYFRSRMTTALLNKIIKGKITNPRDYYKHYLKEKFPKLKIPAELVKKLAESNLQYKYDMFTNVFESYQYVLPTCSNIEAFLNFLSSINPEDYTYNYLGSLRDTAEQAFVLGKKLSYCWSENRLNEEHNKLSREIGLIKMEKEPLIDYNYSTPVPHPFLKIIGNNRELFLEGNGMYHCVFSNYSSRVAEKTYFVFHYDDGETHATVGVIKNMGRWAVEQVRSRKNGTVSNTVEQSVKDYISTAEMQEFFNTNCRVLENAEKDFSIL